MTQPRRTQAERRQQTYDALVEAAVGVIARRGYAEATLQLIADAAGVSKGAVHYHFRAKSEIVAPVLARCEAHLRASAAAAWRRDGPPAERMRAALRAMWTARAEGGREVAALVDLATLGVHDAAVRAEVAAVRARCERDVARELDAAVASLGLRPRVPPATVAPLLFALLDGFTLRRFFVDDDGAEVLAAVETVAFSVFTV